MCPSYRTMHTQPLCQTDPMAIREQDLTVINAWAASYAPDGDDRLRLRADVDGHHVTIVESVRLDPAAEWTETTVARLRFTALTELWSLFSADHAGEFHAHESAPTERVSALLQLIDEDSDGLCWE